MVIFAKYDILPLFSIWLCQPGVVSKDLTVWLNGQWSWTCQHMYLSPSFPWSAPVQMHDVPTPESMFASINKQANFGKFIF
jgi:hypothetical protein